MKDKLQSIRDIGAIVIGAVTVLGFILLVKSGWRPTTFTIGPFGGPIPTASALREMPSEVPAVPGQALPTSVAEQQAESPSAGIDKIVFLSSRAGGAGIFVMNSDGTNAIPVLRYPAYEWEPTWSPDGRWIAFSSDRDDPDPYGCANIGISTCNFEIYVMASNGTELTRLTNDPGDDEYPAWSPDGRLIAFVSNRGDPKRSAYNMYVMSADGTNVSIVQTDVPYSARPSWSPDGKSIAFASFTDGHYQISVASPVTGTAVKFSGAAGDSWHPAWSPDGSRIAFTSSRDDPHPGRCGTGSGGLEACNLDIYVMNVDGTNVTRLTNDQAPDEDPVWAPDGNRIAFVSKRDGNAEIYVMNPDGSAQFNLTNDPAEDWDPGWSRLR